MSFANVRSGAHGRAPLVLDSPVDPGTLSAYRSEAFPPHGPVPWLDRPGADGAIERALDEGLLTESDAVLARDFARDGVVVIKGAFTAARLDRSWAAYEQALADGTITVPAEPVDETDRYPGRALNAHHSLAEIDSLLNDEHVREIVAMLLGVPVRPFQTIIGHKGSQQREHSDSIHMTTYPLGYLAATWTAFEDIHEDSGPLVYYPGSHRLPFVFARDVGISEDDFRVSGYRTYHERYEPAIAALLEQHGLQPQHFVAKKGDVLVWHANLIHGGSQRRDLRWSRRALVCHYFAEGAVCYHDLASAPADFGRPR